MDLPSYGDGGDMDDFHQRLSNTSSSGNLYSDSNDHLPEDGPPSRQIMSSSDDVLFASQHIRSTGGDTATTAQQHQMDKDDDKHNILGEEAGRGENIVYINPLMPTGESTGERESSYSVMDHSLRDDASTSTLSQESVFNKTSFFPQSRMGQWLCVILTGLFVLSSFAVAGVCGSGLCRNDASSAGDRSSTNVLFNTHPPADVNVRAPSAPTASLTTVAMAPTATPTIARQAFVSTQELYDAVDQYLATGSADPVYGYPIGDWDVSQLTNFAKVFSANRNGLAFDFNEDLNGWDTSRALTMESMFYDARSFTGNISSWNTSSVTNMREALSRATNFQGDLSQWDVSRVTTINGMCKFCVAFDFVRNAHLEVSDN